MKILFDQGAPVPLKRYLTDHEVQTVFELGWSDYSNGELLSLAEESFDLLISTDQNLKYQQNLVGSKLRIAVLMTTSWPRIRSQVDSITTQIDRMASGEYKEITVP